MSRSSGGVERAPATARFEIATAGPGGPSKLAQQAQVGVRPATGIVIDGYVCHQCR